MDTTFETLRHVKDQLDDWIREATPATAEARAELTPAQRTDLEHLNDLSGTLNSTLFKLMADDLRAPAEEIERARAELEVIAGKMTDLAKDISTLGTVIQVIGTAVSIASGLLSVGLGLLA
jgi:hypothetical protein